MTQLSARANELHEQAVADFKVSERFAFSFLMKVKKIRDERLYKELGFTSFESYCESSWNVKRGYMDDRILVADSFGQDFDRTCGQLGHKKSLLLARMEPEVRKQIETSVDVNETTVRQLKQLERSLQEAEQRAQRFAKELQERPTIEKPVSMPSDKATISQLESQLRNNQQLLDVYKRKAELSEKEAKEFADLKKKIEFLHREKDDLHRQIESATSLSGLAVKIDNFLKTELSPIRYSRALERLDSEVAVRNLTEIIESVEHWCEDMRRYLPKNGRKVVIDYDPAG